MNKQKIILTTVLLLSSVLVAGWRVNDWWMEARCKRYPDRGDFDFYVNCTRQLTLQEHPTVPVMLFLSNLLFLGQGKFTVLFYMTAGYALLFMLVFHLVHRTTRMLPLACAGFCMMLGSVYYTIVPTALKNLWALNLMLFTLTLLPRLRNPFPNKTFYLTVISSLLVALTHSIPIWLLLVCFFTFLPYWHHHFKKETRWLLITAILTVCVSLVVLEVTNRLRKLSRFFASLFANPIVTMATNFRRLWGSSITVFPFFIVFIFSFFALLIYQWKTRQYQPLSWGLVLCIETLYLMGPTGYAGRFISTATPLVIILYSIVLAHLVKPYWKKESIIW